MEPPAYVSLSYWETESGEMTPLKLTYMELVMEIDDYINPGSLPWLPETSVWNITNPPSPTC
jgi:hypothetical protein